MASVKVKFRPSSINGKEGFIYYQIIHNRVIRQLKTGYKIYPCEWNETSNSIIIENDERRNYLNSISGLIEWDLKRFDMILRQKENLKADYTSDDIVFIFQNKTEEQSFFRFMQSVIVQLRQMGKQRTSETYQVTFKSFFKFRNGEDLLLDEICSEVIQMYEAYLKSKGMIRNSSSFYLRILRAVYNRAVEKELTMQRFPFRHVYTGIFSCSLCD